MNIEFIQPRAELITHPHVLQTYPGIVEEAARTCYKSRRSDSLDLRDRFLRKLLLVDKHESVFEHCSITYRIVCSRAASHQLVRHRIASYSQESMRYCDYTNDGKFTSFQVILPESVSNNTEASFHVWNAYQQAYMAYDKLRSLGVAPEDARFVLPHGTRTELVVSMNIRQWRHVLRQRALNRHAQWEVRKIGKEILQELARHLPVFFEDMAAEVADVKAD